jgi:hypothetical protein
VSDIVAGSVLETTQIRKPFTKLYCPTAEMALFRKNRLLILEWKSAIQPTGLAVCKTAVSVEGIPYLWGGASPKAADCSGFVQSVYFRNGICLRRDASLQFHQGQEIDIAHWDSTLREGDLLFFGSNREKLQATHVAIYLGNSEFIHASGRVMVSSLDARSNFDRGEGNDDRSTPDHRYIRKQSFNSSRTSMVLRNSYYSNEYTKKILNLVRYCSRWGRLILYYCTISGRKTYAR